MNADGVPARQESTRRGAGSVVWSVMVGLALVCICGPLMSFFARTWGWSAITVFSVSVFGAFALAGVALIIKPFRANRVIGLISHALLWPLSGLVFVGDYYTRLSSLLVPLFFLVLVPALLWAMLYVFGILPQSLEKAFMYCALVVMSMVVRFAGDRIAAVYIRWVKPGWNEQSVLSRLEPNWMRFYTYALTGLAYFANVLERFVGRPVVPAAFWLLPNKDVSIEVLLTVVAIDSAMAAWKDIHRPFDR